MNGEPHIIEREGDAPILIDQRGPREGEVVIFCHGYKGYKDWGCWNLLADYLSEHSIGVVKFNFSKNGGTMLEPIDFPDLESFAHNNYSQEVKDLKDVIDAVEQEFGFSSLTLIGHSRGGGIVSLVAAQDTRVDKLITLASVSDFSNRFPKDKHLELWKERGVYHVQNGRTGQNMPHYYQFFEDYLKNREQLNIRKAVSSLEIPHLIIHGANDDAVNVNEAFNLKSWHPQADLKIIENTGHTFGSKQPWESDSMPRELEDVAELIVDFMAEE